MTQGSYIQKLFTSRDRNNVEYDIEFGNIGNTFVGEIGRLWYNPESNCFYVSDGETPGGIPVGSCGPCNCEPNISVADEGTVITTNVESFNFVGNGVVASNVGNAVTITIPGSDATGLTTYDEGNLLTLNTQSYNFVGEGVTATNVGNAVTVTVGPGIAYLYSGSFYFDSATIVTVGFNSNSTLPIQVASTEGFSNSGYIRIEKEVIRYTGKTATSFTGITRGQAGSNGATHAAGVGVAQAQVAEAGVPHQVQIDTTAISNNVTLDPATGNVTIGGAGTYNLQFSVQTENFGNDFDDTVIWFVLNGNAIPASASYCSVVASHAGGPGSNIMTVNIFYTLAAGDIIALYWTSLGGTTTLSSIPPIDGTVPQSPSVIFTVNRIY